MAVQWQVPVLVRCHLTDRSGRVAGYALRMDAPYDVDPARPATADDLSPGAPDDRRSPLSPDTVLAALDEEYRSTDLATLAEARLFCVQATPALLAGAGDLLDEIDHLVVEVPSWLLTTPGVDQLMAQQRDQGVRFALGGFRGTPEQVQALDVADMVMVDAQDPRLAETIAARGSAQVVVRGPVSRAGVDLAVDAGADLVETAWVYPDDDRDPGVLDAVEAQCLALLSALDRQPAEPEQVAEVISASPELSVAVLRQVNSSAVALRHRVDSVRHATVLAGPRRLRTVAVAALAGARRDGIDALWAVLARARAVADLTGRETGYTAGLLSGLADVRRFPLDWLATRAGVSPQVSAALLARRGALGAAVAAVAAHEAGNPAEVAALGMDPWVVSRAWLAAVAQTRTLLPDLV